MNRILGLGLALFLTTILTAQPGNMGGLQFKLQLIEGNTWGVFVRPMETIAPSANTSAGTGQVTLVAPSDFEYSNFVNHAGTWVQNARVNNPVEAPDKAYISFGFVMDEPKIMLYSYEETLLFTFEASSEYTGRISLFDNANDPFLPPNSYGSNPGNDLSIIDFGTGKGVVYYTYEGNYSPTVPVARKAARSVNGALVMSPEDEE
ncbi:MAG: hypothetical protein KatS3mg029_0945 [Saprospiraceae bacterium]|nr:MAG: hypothetical protein KatS3mg029_0945 [Saprospiraceae bacterium]